MTITINNTGTSLAITNSNIFSDYELNNTLGTSIVYTLTQDCGVGVIHPLTYDGVGNANYNSVTDTMTHNITLLSGVYTIELKYEVAGSTKVETACVFFDLNNEYKCKANNVITSSNAYLYYQFLVDAQLCDSCSCSTMCDGLTILKSKLDDTTDECNTCD